MPLLNVNHFDFQSHPDAGARRQQLRNVWCDHHHYHYDTLPILNKRYGAHELLAWSESCNNLAQQIAGIKSFMFDSFAGFDSFLALPVSILLLDRFTKAFAVPDDKGQPIHPASTTGRSVIATELAEIGCGLGGS